MRTEHNLTVRVPGSSANLGPGFDVLGMAVSLIAHVGIGHMDRGTEEDATLRGEFVAAGHPAAKAFVAAGGVGELFVRSPIPSGRGLGFSGAMHVAGAALGFAQRAGVASAELDEFVSTQQGSILDLASDLEGHADNAAASLLGGVTACAQRSDRYVARRVPMASKLEAEARIVVWVPNQQTSTSESRAKLPAVVSRADAVFNMSRLTHLLIALATDDRSTITWAVEDRLHQDDRLAHVPFSAAALEAMRSAGATACWLSGSGPTVACLAWGDEVVEVESALTSDELTRAGRTLTLEIDRAGLQAAN